MVWQRGMLKLVKVCATVDESWPGGREESGPEERESSGAEQRRADERSWDGVGGSTSAHLNSFLLSMYKHIV